MKQSLFDIVQNVSGHNDADFIQSMCNKIQESGYCNGVKCDECPFNSSEGVDRLAIELDKDSQSNK